MPLEWNHILALFFGLVVIYLLGKLLYVPLKFTLRLLANAVIGGLVLILFNVVGGIWGFTIGVNIVTAVIVGILGVPGVLLLLILKSIAS